MPSTPRSILYSVIIFIGVLVVGCVTPRPETPAPCVTAKMTGLELRWGTKDDSSQTVEVFRMNTKGEIFRYAGPRVNDPVDAYLLHIDQREYCSVASSVNACFLKTQALNSPGRKARFIEYYNPSTDVYLRAVWNPDLQTFQSRDMRKEYDQLMALVNR